MENPFAGEIKVQRTQGKWPRQKYGAILERKLVADGSVVSNVAVANRRVFWVAPAAVRKVRRSF